MSRMFGWLRRMKVTKINIFGVELEFDHSPATVAEDDEIKASLLKPIVKDRPIPPALPELSSGTPARIMASTVKDRPTPNDVAEGSPAMLTVLGQVVGTIDKDLGIRIRNEEEVRAFWEAHQVDSKLDWMGKGPPVFSINRKEDRARCKPGDEASMTVVVQVRTNGKRGIKTVAFEVVHEK